MRGLANFPLLLSGTFIPIFIPRVLLFTRHYSNRSFPLGFARNLLPVQPAILGTFHAITQPRAGPTQEPLKLRSTRDLDCSRRALDPHFS